MSADICISSNTVANMAVNNRVMDTLMAVAGMEGIVVMLLPLSISHHLNILLHPANSTVRTNTVAIHPHIQVKASPMVDNMDNSNIHHPEVSIRTMTNTSITNMVEVHPVSTIKADNSLADINHMIVNMAGSNSMADQINTHHHRQGEHLTVTTISISTTSMARLLLLRDNTVLPPKDSTVVSSMEILDSILRQTNHTLNLGVSMISMALPDSTLLRQANSILHLTSKEVLANSTEVATATNKEEVTVKDTSKDINNKVMEDQISQGGRGLKMLSKWQAGFYAV
jgi:hypothetical protein